MASLQALLFDVDGTLADTERDGHRVSFNMAFADAGLDWDWTEALYGKLLKVTGGKERIRHFIDTCDAKYPAVSDLSAWIADLHKAKTKHYTELLAKGKIPLRPGVLRLLTEARSVGMRLAIVTTTTPANVTALLEATLGRESIGWFEVIAAGDIVPAKKPAPDIYTYTLRAMNLAAEDCLALEDSGQGLKSSIAAGIKTVITSNEYTAEQDFAAASLVVSDFGEPKEPCHLIAGRLGNSPCVTLDILKAIIEG
jgi:HAD superfamily hydrolase (TIGR01509 family)